MARVTAPLFSFSASGQLAKSLVYFPWKGVDAVRSYTIPSNPNSADQQTQRGYFGDAITAWHNSALLVADDKTAWDKYASSLSRAMSGFNAFVKDWLDISVAGLGPDPAFNGALSQSGVGQFDCTVEEDGGATAANLLWGYSKTSLINTLALAEVVNVWGVLNQAANTGAIVFGRFEIRDAGGVIGHSGIYQVTIL
jgi:hypothetical protein